jgi:hypothetical protein
MENDSLIIIGGGPSVKELDFTKIKDKFTFGLNFVCHFFEPTALVWVDRDFYSTHQSTIDKLDCVKITKVKNEVPPNIIKLQDSNVFYGEQGLKQGIYKSFLVGLFSLSLGIALRFKEIYLLGYDCGFVENKSHFHDIEHRGRNNESPYTKLHMFNIFADRKNIYNVSLVSKLEIFPKISYAEFYERVKDCTVDQVTARSWLIDSLK